MAPGLRRFLCAGLWLAWVRSRAGWVFVCGFLRLFGQTGFLPARIELVLEPQYNTAVIVFYSSLGGKASASHFGYAGLFWFLSWKRSFSF